MKKNTPDSKPSAFLLAFFVGLLFLSFVVGSPKTAVGNGSTPTVPTIPTSSVINLPLIFGQVATSTPSCVPPAPIGTSNAVNEASILAQIHGHRGDNGLGALNSVDELVQAARRHALDMATNGFTDHVGSDGSTYEERVAAACYDAVATNEIIGWGFGGDATAMVNWWMNSSIHRSIILTTSLDDLGVGYIQLSGSEWVHYWTVNFGRPDGMATGASGEQYVCVETAVSPAGGSSITYLSDQPCP